MTLFCRICGFKTSSLTEISDKKWEVIPNIKPKICPTCFGFWSVGDEEQLDIRYTEKLKKLAKGELG